VLPLGYYEVFGEGKGERVQQQTHQPQITQKEKKSVLELGKSQKNEVQDLRESIFCKKSFHCNFRERSRQSAPRNSLRVRLCCRIWVVSVTQETVRSER